MNFSKIHIAGILLMSLLIYSCIDENMVSSFTGSGNIVSQTQNLDSFTELEVRNHCDVEVVIGTENKVEYSDHENIIQFLIFEVENNRLILKTVPEQTTIYNSQAKAKIYVTGNLYALLIKGSGNIGLSDSFDGLNQLNISGSGNITANSELISSDMNCNISGSGNMNLLMVNTSSVTGIISGSGNISIAVTTNLDGTITGSGNIYYQGDPAVVKNITGSGHVIKL